MKTVVITGATSGIGFAAAQLLARQGYRIIGVGHSCENCERARATVLTDAPGASVVYFTADLMQQREVNRVADEIGAYLSADCGGGLYALINNAGCVRSWYTTTEEGYEQQFALNVLAPFLLTYRLLPYIKRAKGRVIMTGSESHKHMKVRWDDVLLRGGYNPLTAYKQSKLCNLLFAKGLNERCGTAGIRAYAVDPGLVNTDIGNKQTGGLVNLVWKLRKKHGVAPQVPAETYAYLCAQDPALQGLYYRLCRENRCSGQVTSENADRFFELGERLCGVNYDMNDGIKEVCV
jgi:NAD(P)-dependent dehydrogenase (short-subunit alcohol dehydrogenase family)